MAVREGFAQQRAHRDADREHHQQQRCHLLIAAQHIPRERGELRQKHRAEEPHPRDAQQRAEHAGVLTCQLQIAPGLAEGIPVQLQARIGCGRDRDPRRGQPAQHGHAQTGHRDPVRPGLGDAHQQAATHIAQQNGDKRAHLDQAIAPSEFALAEVLRKVGVLHRPEKGRVQAHQQHTGQQQRHQLEPEAQSGQGHDADLQQFDRPHDARLVVLVGPLAGRGRQQHERQDEQGPDDQAGHLRRQPADLQLVGHEHRQGKLEEVVVGSPQKLGEKEGCEPPLLQQGKLSLVGRWHVLHHVHPLCSFRAL